MHWIDQKNLLFLTFSLPLLLSLMVYSARFIPLQRGVAVLVLDQHSISNPHGRKLAAVLT